VAVIKGSAFVNSRSSRDQFKILAAVRERFFGEIRKTDIKKEFNV
jgi:hypothetical protein